MSGAAPAASAPAPRWARRAATVAALTTFPSALWRTAMALGVPVGVSDEIRRARYGFPGWGTAYLLGLTILLVTLSLLTLGLVHRWGEVVPRWVPAIGGRTVPPLAAVVPAGVGAAALTVLWASVFSNVRAICDLYGLDGAAQAVMLACYSPLLLWGPLLGAVTASCARRRVVPRRGGRVSRAAAAGGPTAC